MSYAEVTEVDFGDCKGAFGCQCSICSFIESLICRCGVAYIDHAYPGHAKGCAQFALAKWQDQ